MVQRQSGNRQREDITFHERRGQKRPGVHERELRHERQVRDNDVRVLCPLAVSDSRAQERLE